MKIGYYHYYFKEARRKNAPRVCHDIRPLLKNYLEFEDQSWKSQITTEDGEELLLVETPKSDVFMLIATRRQEIIKAVHKHTLSCVEISQRLMADESAGFAAYFCADQRSIGLASTLRGPRTTAFSTFTNSLITRLGAGRWKMHLGAIGSSITVEKATAMAFVSRTNVSVSNGNPLFVRFKAMLGLDSDDIASFEVIVRGKKKKDIGDIFTKIAAEAKGEGLDRLKVRARAVAGEALADYFVEEHGKMSDDIGTGSEKKMIQEVSKKFHGHSTLMAQLDEIAENHHYETLAVPELDRIRQLDFWNNHLLANVAATDE